MPAKARNDSPALRHWALWAIATIAITIGLTILAFGGDAGRFFAYLAATRPHLRAPDFGPLAAASPAIQVHVAAAVIAFGVGAVQLVGPKGRAVHIALGWVWVAAMATVAGSSLLITEITPGRFSFIHLFTAWTAIALPMGLAAILWRKNGKAHGRTMAGLFFGGLIIAGAFTFLPGRLMWAVFLG